MLERTPVLRKPHFVAYQKENADDANEADNESFGNINVSFNVSIRPSISRGRSDLVKVLHTPNIKPTNRNLAKVTRTDCATPASILKVRPAKTMPNQVKLDKPLRFDSDGEDEPSTILEPTMDIEPDSDQDRFSDIGMQQPGHLLKATDGQHMEADVTNLQEHDMSVEHSMQHPTHDPNAVDEFVFSESNEIQMSEATKEQMMTGEHKDGMTDQELTPTKISYVFSPPLTRSRRKKSSGKLSKKEDPCLDDTFGKSDTTISADSNTTASTSGNTNPSSEEKKSGRKTPKRNARTTTTTTATADTPSHSMRLRK